MPDNPQILAFAGSARTGSLNKKLIAVAVQAARAAGGEVTLIDLRDYPLPVYDGDLEAAQGIPANARRLKVLFKAHQGLLISSPENNASVSALLKNTIDWISRDDGKESGLAPYERKVAALLSASPSFRGGLRGIPLLRAILDALGVLVLPGHVGIAHADEAFGPAGELLDARNQKAVKSACERLVETCRRLES
jgi:chromate reductase, NAD(P)H dehydrogenase (quinone)